MALNIKIDLTNCYDIRTVSSDLTVSEFRTELTGGYSMPIGILISNTSHQWLPEVYNLAFGPFRENDEIDDTARLTHADHSKVFSTIILTALAFLKVNPGKFLGIDGSNNARAYLYFRIIQNNYHTLHQYFDLYGVNYYVRILRKKKDTDTDHPVDPSDIEAIPRTIAEKEAVHPEKLYNYFIFRHKKQDGQNEKV